MQWRWWGDDDEWIMLIKEMNETLYQ